MVKLNDFVSRFKEFETTYSVYDRPLPKKPKKKELKPFSMGTKIALFLLRLLFLVSSSWVLTVSLMTVITLPFGDLFPCLAMLLFTLLYLSLLDYSVDSEESFKYMYKIYGYSVKVGVLLLLMSVLVFIFI